MNNRSDLPLRKIRIFFAPGLDFDLLDARLICPSGKISAELNEFATAFIAIHRSS
jgi:hypothetical protein